MRWIALNLDRSFIFDGDQDSASIRTIVRAGGVYDFFHDV
jgi:hypothetical protein